MIRSIAVLVCLLVVVSCTSSDGSIGDAQSGPEATSVAAIEANPVLARFDCADRDRWQGGEDLQIFFEPGADPAAIDELLAGLDESDQVESSTYFDRDASFDEFTEFWTQQNSQPPPLSINDIPTRVALAIAAPVDENIAALLRPIEGDPLVFDIGERPAFCADSADDMAVLCAELGLSRNAFLLIVPSAPASEAIRVGEMLEAINNFKSITFVGKEQVQEELKTTGGDQPISSLSIDASPSRWEFTVPLNTDVTSIINELSQDPAVFTASVAPFCDPTEW